MDERRGLLSTIRRRGIEASLEDIAASKIPLSERAPDAPGSTTATVYYGILEASDVPERVTADVTTVLDHVRRDLGLDSIEVRYQRRIAPAIAGLLVLMGGGARIVRRTRPVLGSTYSDEGFTLTIPQAAPRLMWVAAHEARHVYQLRLGLAGGLDSLLPARRRELEQDADGYADAVLLACWAASHQLN